jgi:N-acetylglucosamine-6-phosphate deacetylase
VQTSKINGLLYSDSRPVSIEIDSGVIKKITRPDTVDNDKIIAPGLIDLQINGIDGIGFSEANLSLEGIESAVKKIWSLGVTTFLPTLITIPRARLIKNLSLLAKAKENLALSHLLYGFHLEGPFISAENGPRGAHNQTWVKEIDPVEFERYWVASGKQISLVTLDPSKSGALEFIGECVEKNICIALGHHDASAEEIVKAVEAGASLSTHLGNGSSVYMHRHQNPIWPQLANDRLKASIIADGFHLLPEELLVFYRTKTKDNLILISDMTNFSGMPPGTYDWHNQQINISGEGRVSLANSDILAGSYAPLIEDVGNMVRFTGCPLVEAIDMATKTPASFLNMKDRGEIKEGNIADLILFTMEEQKLILEKTILCGKVVYSKK